MRYSLPHRFFLLIFLFLFFFFRFVNYKKKKSEKNKKRCLGLQAVRTTLQDYASLVLIFFSGFMGMLFTIRQHQQPWDLLYGKSGVGVYVWHWFVALVYYRTMPQDWPVFFLLFFFNHTLPNCWGFAWVSNYSFYFFKCSKTIKKVNNSAYRFGKGEKIRSKNRMGEGYLELLFLLWLLNPYATYTSFH